MIRLTFFCAMLIGSMNLGAAISNVLLKQDVWGSTKVQLWKSTLTSVTSGIIATGLSTVHSAQCNNETTGDDAGKVQRNYSAASTVTAGNVFVSSFTSGDELSCLILGN